MRLTRIVSKEPFTFFPIRVEGVASRRCLVDDKKTSVSLECHGLFEIVFNMYDAFEIYRVDLSNFSHGSFEKKSVGIISDSDLIRFLDWSMTDGSPRLRGIHDSSLHGNFISRLSSVVRIFSNTYGVGYVQERILF